MFTRRKFIHVGVAAGAGLMMMPHLTFAQIELPVAAGTRNKRWLIGNPKRGCSTPGMSPEFLCDINTGVRSFEEYAFLTPPNHGGYC